jgi:hypothetical protein
MRRRTVLRSLLHAARALALGLITALSGPGAAQAEELVGRNIDTRFMLAFAADGERIGTMLPEGWSAIGFPSGPLAGANLLVGLEERQLAMTSEGRPADPPRSRAVAFMTLAKGNEGVRLYVLRVLTSDAGYDLYPDAVHAAATRSSLFDATVDAARQSETWSFAADTGGRLDISLNFDVGTGAWASSEARPYSASDPELSWIFRYDQLVDLLTSEPMGKPLAGNFAISTDLPDIGGILDGSEALVGILSIPVYVREVFAP